MMNSGESQQRYHDAVLAVVSLIPAGRVLAYGDVAELLGAGGPRQVGRVMSQSGAGQPWWRVLRADGRPPEGHEEQALDYYRKEQTPVRYTRGHRPGDRDASWRVIMSRARWQPSAQEWVRLDALAGMMADTGPAPTPEP